jgi:predicted GH43/DUF377 family glycosyl hydrolase
MHLFGITHEEPMKPHDEDYFAHATSPTLTGVWKKEPFALAVDESKGERHLWAPHVVYHNGLYYMYYCAGSEKGGSTYKINLATSKNLFDWQRHPANPMVVDGYDARDPFIYRMKDKWVMYYTANSKPEGGNHVVFALQAKTYSLVEQKTCLHRPRRRHLGRKYRIAAGHTQRQILLSVHRTGRTIHTDNRLPQHRPISLGI